MIAKRGKWRSESTWQDQVRTFVHEIAPHKLDHVPVYCLDDAGLPELFQCAPGVNAYTTVILDLALRPHIAKWQGRGFAVVVAAEEMACPERLMATIAHELAHFAECMVASCRIGLIDMVATDLARMSPAAKKYASQGLAEFGTPTTGSSLPWSHHGLPFIWLCCHLEYRAWEFGDIPKPPISFAGPHYGLSPAVAYLRAAGTAPRDMADASLLEIAARGPNDAIEELFESDCKAWRESHPKKGKGEYEQAISR